MLLSPGTASPHLLEPAAAAAVAVVVVAAFSAGYWEHSWRVLGWCQCSRTLTMACLRMEGSILHIRNLSPNRRSCPILPPPFCCNENDSKMLICCCYSLFYIHIQAWKQKGIDLKTQRTVNVIRGSRQQTNSNKLWKLLHNQKTS